MKLILWLCFISLTSTVFAASRDIYDLQYLPTSGTVYGMTDVNYVNGKASGNLFDIDISGYVVEQTVGYSFTNQFSLQASMDYGHTKTNVDYASIVNAGGQADEDRTTKGLSDPSFTGRYRVLDSDFRFDIVGGLLLSTGDTKVDGNDYDNKTGGSEINGGVEFGQKQQDFQWYVGANLKRSFESTTDTKGSGKVTDDAHNTWTFQGEILNRLADASFLRTMAGVQFVDEYQDDQSPKETTAGEAHYQVSTQFQQLFTPDLMGKIGVAYNTFNKAGFDDYSYVVFNVGANYQF